MSGPPSVTGEALSLHTAESASETPHRPKNVRARWRPQYQTLMYQALIDFRRGREYADCRFRRGDMPEDQSGQFTELLRRWAQGDEKALGALVPLVYRELRGLLSTSSNWNGRVTPSKAPLWFTRPTSGCWGANRLSCKTARTSSLLRPGSCVKSLWTTPAAVERPNATGDAGSLSRIWTLCPVNGDAELLALDDALSEFRASMSDRERS